jgi:hypothetical protein
MFANARNRFSVRTPSGDGTRTITKGPMRIATAKATLPLCALLGAAARRTRATRLVAPLLAAFALAAVGSLAGAAAPADARYLRTTDTFHFPAWSPGFRPCIHRTVGLRRRDFLHGAYAVSTSHRKDPDLRQAPIHVPVAGSYSWEACRGYNSHIHHYEVRSTLRGHGFSHTIKNVFQRDPNQLGPSHVYGDGSYEWGGRLVIPEPPGTTHPSG